MVRMSLGVLGSGFVSRIWMLEERRPGAIRYRRST
jgi:hypothetical protein